MWTDLPKKSIREDKSQVCATNATRTQWVCRRPDGSYLRDGVSWAAKILTVGTRKEAKEIMARRCPIHPAIDALNKLNAREGSDE